MILHTFNGNRAGLGSLKGKQKVCSTIGGWQGHQGGKCPAWKAGIKPAPWVAIDPNERERKRRAAGGKKQLLLSDLAGMQEIAGAHHHLQKRARLFHDSNATHAQQAQDKFQQQRLDQTWADSG